jgi:hypothetical protein
MRLLCSDPGPRFAPEVHCIAYLRETRGRHSRVAGRLLDAIERDSDHEYEHGLRTGSIGEFERLLR